MPFLDEGRHDEGDEADVHGIQRPAETRDTQELAVGAGEGQVFEAFVESRGDVAFSGGRRGTSGCNSVGAG